MNKFNKYFISALLLIAIAALSGCSDCNLETADYPCRIREATITKFDPRLDFINDSVLVPVPTYSNHTFQFPNDNSSSGLLTNDQRFDDRDYLKQAIVIDELDFIPAGETEQFKAQLVNIYPPNPLMIGDIMVVDADFSSSPATAKLRFYGSLSKFPGQFESENAYRFCQEYLTTYRAADPEYNSIRSRATQYGNGLPNSGSYKFTINNIRVLNSLNKDSTASYRSKIPVDILNSLLNSGKSTSVDITVKSGDVYYYHARNGKEFAVVVADIRQGSFEPFLKRVTIKFSELVGTKQTSCPE